MLQVTLACPPAKDAAMILRPAFGIDGLGSRSAQEVSSLDIPTFRTSGDLRSWVTDRSILP